MNSICLLILIFVTMIETSSALSDSRTVIGSCVGGFLGLVIVILDLIAIFELLSSAGRGMCSKLIWILIILFFPIGGLLLYWCCARRRTVDEIL